MNDLFTNNSFKKYKDLEQQVYIDEKGNEAWNETVNLDAFFKQIENVKDDMGTLEKLYKSLEDTNEESKHVHDAKSTKQLRTRMDSDVAKSLKLVKVVKQKLETLEHSNAEQRKVPGYGAGSSSDRTRTSVLNGLMKKLKITMDDFQSLRAKIASEYKETVGRRYFTITGEKANNEMIENLIASGEGETLVQRAIQEQGRGQILDTIQEIQERHDAVKEIERSLIELHQVFLDMAALVDAQGQQLNDIESHVARASSFVRGGTVQLEAAKDIQKNSRKCICIGVFLAICLVLVLLLPILIHFNS